MKRRSLPVEDAARCEADDPDKMTDKVHVL